jgi:hypothetical protein
MAIVSFAYAEENNIPFVQVAKDITYLASDQLKGRGNYSPEIRLAADYIAMRFKESGLSAPNNISGPGFLQKYNIIKTIPKKISLVINGQNIATEKLTMASTVINFSWSIDNQNKNTEFTLHNINANDNMQAIVSSLNKQGGQHIVLLNPAHTELFERYQHYFQQGTTKLIQENIDTKPRGVIVLALSTLTVEKINTLFVSGISTVNSTELTNVVAVLPGKKNPEEIVLYSAHYDHLGVKVDKDKDKDNGKSDNIYNGADDDASGTTAIINLAQYYAKQKNNARTLMFAAFSAEEIGGFGSRFFSSQIDPKKIIAMINIEMIGKPSKFGAGNIWMTGMNRSTLGQQLNTTLAKIGKQIYEDPYPEQDLFYRSDNATLARLGVPAHSFSSTQLDIAPHYHKTSDDILSLNLTSLHQVIEMLAIATQSLVDGSVTPSRINKESIKRKGIIF